MLNLELKESQRNAISKLWNDLCWDNYHDDLTLPDLPRPEHATLRGISDGGNGLESGQHEVVEEERSAGRDQADIDSDGDGDEMTTRETVRMMTPITKLTPIWWRLRKTSRVAMETLKHRHWLADEPLNDSALGADWLIHLTEVTLQLSVFFATEELTNGRPSSSLLVYFSGISQPFLHPALQPDLIFKVVATADRL